MEEKMERTNEKSEKKYNNNETMLERAIPFDKGITLIALVITIIVLLILAGVTIASITGENGILRKSTKCSRKK